MIWYALNVPRQKEFIVERILGAEGYDVRVPIIHSLRRINRQAKKKVLSAIPCFPGWVFIAFDEDHANWDRLTRFGIVRGLAANWKGEPLVFRAGVMHQIMTSFHQKPVRYSREVRKRFRSGILAEIISGPYQDRKVRIVPIPHHIPMLIEVQEKAA